MIEDRCALYMIHDTASNAIKIGISSQPETRLQQIQGHYNVGRCRLLRTTWFMSRDEARKYERTFHMRYKSSQSQKQGGREWFNLSADQANGFAEWMERSSQKRAYKALRLKASVQKSNAQMLQERWENAWSMLPFGLVIGIVFSLMATSPTPLFGFGIAAWALGFFSAIKGKREITQVYDIDGKSITRHLPVYELMQMGLWDEKVEHVSLNGHELPDEISSELVKNAHSIE
jgi:hypothetical protein